MTWREIAPPPRVGPGLAGAPAVLRANPSGGRFKQCLTLLVRPALIGGGGAPWWHPGATVTVALGEGDVDGGRLRVCPADPGMTSWTLKPVTGRRAQDGGPARLVIPDFPGLPAAGCPPMRVAVQASAGALFIDLPPALAPKAATPYRGVAASTGLAAGVGRPTRSVAA